MPETRIATNRSTVLVVDEDTRFAEQLADELALHFTVERATSGRHAIQAVMASPPDAVFLDQNLPDRNGVGVIEDLRNVGYTAPVILLTTPQDIRVAATALRHGAADFVVKDTDDVLCEQLIPMTVRAIERWSNDKELEYLRQREEDRAQHTLQLNRELQNKNEQLGLACAQIEDSHRKLHRKNVRLSELYDTAYRFVDNVSHEMRTPLTVIKEFSAIMLDGLAGPLNDHQHKYLDIVATTAADLTQMVDDMLDLSKLEAGLLRVERSRVTLPEIMAGITDALQQKSRISQVELDIELPADLPALFCDREKIGRALINLVCNAMKFSPEGSRVKVWAKRTTHPDEVFVGVTDSGHGIASEHLQVIFERFKQVGSATRTSVQGFGIGLNIVRELVHLCLGEVTVDSAVGVGSTFGFTLPAFDYGAIIRRYRERLPVTAGGGADLAFIRVHPERITPEIADHIRGGLAHNTRPFDLTFARPEHGDVIVVAATHDPSESIQRLAVRNREELRLSPGSTVKLCFETMAQWPADSPTDDIVSFFTAQFDSAETADA